MNTCINRSNAINPCVGIVVTGNYLQTAGIFRGKQFLTADKPAALRDSASAKVKVFRLPDAPRTPPELADPGENS